MNIKTTLSVIAALAALSVASPAFAQAFSSGWGTGNVQQFAYGSDGKGHAIVPGEQPAIQGRNGMHAFAYIPGSLSNGTRAFAYVPGGFGSNATSGYDPSAASQR